MRRKLPLLFGAAFFALALGACEGPEGPQGPAGPQGQQGQQGIPGADGENALNTCSDCHHADATIVAVEHQVAQSPHGEEFPFYEDRNPCSACHSHNGLTIWAETGEMPGAEEFADVEFWAPINCRTCHQIHETFTGDDFALTSIDAVDLMLTATEMDFTATTDEGVVLNGNNLCSTCHQGRIRDPWPDGSADMTSTFEITSTHFDTHHSPQASIVGGALGQIEIPGAFNIPSNQLHDPHGAERGCTGCHMDYDPTAMELSNDHDFDVEVETCQACHATATDFDYHGVQTSVQATLDEILACLVAEGVAAVDPVTGEAHPVLGTYPEPYAAAWVVWASVTYDASFGVHNPGYVQTLLGNTQAMLEANSALCPVVVAP